MAEFLFGLLLGAITVYMLDGIGMKEAVKRGDIIIVKKNVK